MKDDRQILLSVTGWDPTAWVEAFNANAPEKVVVTNPDGPGDPSIVYAVVWKQKPGVLSTLPNLRAIFSIGAGVDHVFQDSSLPEVPIIRIVADDLTARMSEYVVWQVLDHFRQGPTYRAQQAEGVWRELPQLAAKDVVVGIMGIGQLGLDAGQKLVGLGFSVIGWSRTPKSVAGITCHSGSDGLARFLGKSDIVVVLLPLTEATHGILNAEVLGKMKRDTPLGGPILINAGRGGLQVETDILASLDAGHLKAVTLDVFETEPLPANHPLWQHPMVTVTPHCAASSDPGALVPQVLTQMENLENGRPLVGLVDKVAGY